jgi:SPP1 gp7 family putative phage head morphogenesis protein
VKSYDDILDIIVRRQVFLQRLAEEQSVQIAQRLNAAPREVYGILRDGLDEAMSHGAFTKKQQAVLLRMEKELDRALGVNYNAAREWYVKELEGLVAHEVQSGRRVVSSIVSPADKAKIADPLPSALNRTTATVPYTGYTIQEWFAGTQASELNKITARVRVGIANGETLDDVVRGIRGTRAAGYTDGIVQGYTTRQAKTMARTITNGVANAAREEFYKANEDLIAYEVFVATLDGRTSLICASLSQEEYPVGKGPIPPMHPNCRSTRVPVTKLMAKEGLIGKRGWSRETKPRNEMEKQFRAQAKENAGDKKWSNLTPKERTKAISAQRREWQSKNVGQTSANTSYETWLKRQPVWFQKEVLGNARYQLFSKGDLPLTKFVDHNNQQYNLNQLKKVESAAFKRAGI